MHLLLCFLLLVTTLINNEVVNADLIGKSIARTNIYIHHSLVSITFFLETGGPSVLTEGKEALLTCVIMGPHANDTVLWRKEHGGVLTAGNNRVTSDRRFNILHDDGEICFSF